VTRELEVTVTKVVESISVVDAWVLVEEDGPDVEVDEPHPDGLSHSGVVDVGPLEDVDSMQLPSSSTSVQVGLADVEEEPVEVADVMVVE
jgi:hypothetical protein